MACCRALALAVAEGVQAALESWIAAATALGGPRPSACDKRSPARVCGHRRVCRGRPAPPERAARRAAPRPSQASARNGCAVSRGLTDGTAPIAGALSPRPWA
eukprot:CAMPEP_0206014262 /NCGR_PEP_ID=MMETSP1464-20131121/17981_1 /ASSEMBLY_ACC=CAM_ASM_001124 /TAXON_ID=119497 /ORGANISM="Exanthemachrysis gayraliae, Strain RCC1523" /LENGTH=102 /DNA_ID=CAMNT_0053388007 /DNA_START=203 /DNA_END=507 /DNA_ORIENTATION=-